MKILHQKSSQPHQNPMANPSQPHQQPITRFHGWTQHHHYPIRPMLRCHPPTPSNPSPPASLLGRNPAQVPGFWNQPNPGSRLLGGTRPRFQAPGGVFHPGSRILGGTQSRFQTPGAWKPGWSFPEVRGLDGVPSRSLEPGLGSSQEIGSWARFPLPHYTNTRRQESADTFQAAFGILQSKI